MDALTSAGGRFQLEAAQATRAHLLERLGRREEAAAAYERAISLTRDTAEREYLERRRDRAAQEAGRR